MTSSDAAGYERAAIRTYLLGADDESAKHWEAALDAAWSAGDLAESARYAFWLGFGLMMRGQAAPASGWLSRAEVLAADVGTQCRASGYVLLPRCLAAIDDGDTAQALEMAVGATEIADRFDDADLRAFGTLAHAQALIAMGEPDAAIPPHSTTSWLRSPPTKWAHRHRNRVLRGDPRVHGSLRSAPGIRMDECACRMVRFASRHCAFPGPVPGAQVATRTGRRGLVGGNAGGTDACRTLADPPHPALGLAYYQVGELHRLGGDGEPAEPDYRLASRHGYDPIPGRALLECARGDVGAAAAMMQRAVQELRRPRAAPRPTRRRRRNIPGDGRFRLRPAPLLKRCRRSPPGLRRPRCTRRPHRPPDRCCSPTATSWPHWPSCALPVARGRRCTCRTTLRRPRCCEVWLVRRWVTGPAPRWNSTPPKRDSPSWAHCRTWNM